MFKSWRKATRNNGFGKKHPLDVQWECRGGVEAGRRLQP